MNEAGAVRTANISSAMVGGGVWKIGHSAKLSKGVATGKVKRSNMSCLPVRPPALSAGGKEGQEGHLPCQPWCTATAYPPQGRNDTSFLPPRCPTHTLSGCG